MGPAFQNASNPFCGDIKYYFSYACVKVSWMTTLVMINSDPENLGVVLTLETVLFHIYNVKIYFNIVRNAQNFNAKQIVICIQKTFLAYNPYSCKHIYITAFFNH